MRRMFSEKQIKGIVQDSSSEVVEALKGQDISVEGITSKGIANTGNIANTGDIGASGKITGGEIIENMTGYSFTPNSNLPSTVEVTYAGVVKNGNKLTFAIALSINLDSSYSSGDSVGSFIIPSSLLPKLYPVNIGDINYLDIKDVEFASSGTSTIKAKLRCLKGSSNIDFSLRFENFVAETQYYGRIEETFLLSDSLVS